MNHVEYVKAEEKDFTDLVDFINYVFSNAYQPHNFEVLLPGLYSAENFMTGANYMAREGGKIVANVGSYPATYIVCGEQIKVNSITTVSVHPRARSKGYMRKLMDMALCDMRKDGTALSFLMGQRQRYEYFGYEPCGARLNYTCRSANIRHRYNNAFNSEIVLKELHSGDKGAFDDIYNWHNSGNAYIERPYERLISILSTWANKTIGIYLNDKLIGYLSASKDYSSICEMFIADDDFFVETLGAYLNQYGRNDVTIEVYPHEKAFIRHLSGLAESVTVTNDMNFNVIDYIPVLNAFLKLKSGAEALPCGKLTINIRDIGKFTISVSDNHPSVLISDEKPDIECTHLEAMQLLFSPVSPYLLGQLEGNAFARGILPIPLFVRKNDRS